MEPVAILSPQLYASLQMFRRNKRSNTVPKVILPMNLGSVKRRREPEKEEKKSSDKRIRAFTHPKSAAAFPIVDFQVPTPPSRPIKPHRIKSSVRKLAPLARSASAGDLKSSSSTSSAKTEFMSPPVAQPSSKPPVMDFSAAGPPKSAVPSPSFGNSWNTDIGIEDVDLLFDERAIFDNSILNNFQNDILTNASTGDDIKTGPHRDTISLCQEGC
eukprot:1380213-Amorphochlora_amoeboformis.AAC.1